MVACGLLHIASTPIADHQVCSILAAGTIWPPAAMPYWRYPTTREISACSLPLAGWWKARLASRRCVLDAGGEGVQLFGAGRGDDYAGADVDAAAAEAGVRL